MLRHAPSAIAACAVYLAQRSLRRAAPWNSLLTRCARAGHAAAAVARACLPACLPACVSACVPACLPD